MPLQISVGPGTYTQSQLRAIAPDFQISWPAGATSVTIGSASRVEGFQFNDQSQAGQYQRPVPPKPLTPQPIPNVDSAERERAMAANRATAQAVQMGIIPTGTASYQPVQTDRPYVPKQTTVTPPRAPNPLPPPTNTAQAPPLPNLVRNQAAVNQALTKLAQADILLQRAQQLGMNVAEISKQISELRQLLQNAQTHLMS